MREATRAQLEVEDGQVLVGMVGRLVAEKGILEFVEAAKALDDRYVLVVAGPHDPDKADSLTRDLMHQGEESGIRFLGMREAVEHLYGAFDMFVLPSHREGFPRAAMEAAACGLPVIATDIRGCRQVVEHGVNGLLVPLRDVPELVMAITKLGDDHELRRDMGAAAVEKARAEFDERDVVQTVIDAYRDVARDKGLSWAMTAGAGTVTTRKADVGDIRDLAELHKRTISSGFLSSLGTAFLALLYRTLIQDEESRAFVAECGGAVVGFIAGTVDTGAFYRRFLRRHGAVAAVRLVPSLVRPRTLRRIYETLRYGSDGGRADAELLAMAVAPRARRKGVGRRLVTSLQEWADEMDITTMKVVVGVENADAIRLYESCGFVDGRTIEVHPGTSSWELVWSA